VKAEAWKPPLNWVIAAAGSFPVRRGESDAEALENAMRVCSEGRVMAMFPEGTRRHKGLLKKHQPRPHTGAAGMALGTAVPLQLVVERLARLVGTNPDPIRRDDPVYRAASDATE